MISRKLHVKRLFEAGQSMAEIGRNLGLTRQGVYDILKKQGLTGKQQIEERDAQIQKGVIELLEKDPSLSNKIIAEKLGYKEYLIKEAISKVGIKRDHSAICYRAKRKGRVELTKDPLFKLRSVEGKTHREIAETTEFSESTVSRNLLKYGIEKKKVK